MNDTLTPERLLATWFEAEAPASAPEGLTTDIYRVTAAIRPRPAWLARLRGNPMDVIVGGAGRRNARLVPILLLLLLVIAVVGGAVYIGTRPNPRPFVVAPSASPTAVATQPDSLPVPST